MYWRRLCICLLLAVALSAVIWIPTSSQVPVPGRNVNMVAGDELPDGDPWLQRQNEPSIAVSTRNVLHLLAGANDYRTVDMAMPEEELPGLPEGVAAGDAWLGVFKSFNGGQSWISTLLPGYPQDNTAAGMSSPLKGFDAAADPTVRAGANGLFYYSGIAFDRLSHGRSVVFVARYIDNNNKENGDTIQYIDTTVIDEGTSGQFADKPWIAVDKPRGNAGTIPIVVPGLPAQDVPRHNVYLVYSLFVGDLGQNVHNKILFARSTDCGQTWGHPIKLSESERINQGTTMAIDPTNGHIYVAWRRFKSGTETDAILIAKSTDQGRKFSKAKEVFTIDPFDQGTSTTSFRTNAYPTIAVDKGGIVYLAWSQRGVGPGGDARIVITTSTNGKTWKEPIAVDNHADRGHQIMPSLTFAAGRLMITWYDLRKDESGVFEYYIDDLDLLFRHTMDVWVAEGAPGEVPTFSGKSTQVSRYLWAISIDGSSCYQVQFNPPNYPLFKQGTVPFMGDYIDITPSPAFIKDPGGDWRFNTALSDPDLFHVTWTDNRDVRPPPLGNYDWTTYNPPNYEPPSGYNNTALCISGNRTGMRNQNIYTSRIAPGIEVTSLGNSKPLGSIQRTFVVLVKNTTDMPRYFRLVIDVPPGVKASF
ncbi:MAG: exo-alpha-sialidase, partial [Methanomassiliicoccales archaeon]